MAHLKALTDTYLYDYPEGALPWQEGDPWPGFTDKMGGEYFLRMTDDEVTSSCANVRIIDGAYYYNFEMTEVGVTASGDYCDMDSPERVGTEIVYEPYTSVHIDYPEGREPDIKEGLNYLFRITSQADVDAWINHDPNAGMGASHAYKWHDGAIWKWGGTAQGRIDGRWAWVDFDGNVVTAIDGTEGMDICGVTGQLNADYNNDGIVDVMFTTLNNGGAYHAYLALSGPGGYTLTDTGIESKVSPFGHDPIVADLNRDGRPDIFGWDSEGEVTTTYTAISYIQLADGTFMRKPLTIVTDPAEISDAAFRASGNGSFSIHSINMSGFSGTGEGAISDPSMKAIDINLDGYPDLIDEGGHSFLSLPDGRYYPAVFAGKVETADLNGDGIQDLVIFDSPNSQVVLQLSRDGGFEMTQLIENGNISAMYCRDLDGDGLTDILLEMDTPERNGQYAYLAFFHNNGDGTFKRTVKSFEGDYSFTQPFDLNNNGRPSVIAKKEGLSFEFKRIDWDETFSITTSDFYPADGGYPLSQSGYELWDFRDYDGDGQAEFVTTIIGTFGNMSGNVPHLYAPAPLKQNTAPQRMDAPGVIVDRSSGLVKIEWAEGKDAESAAADLTYIIKVAADGGGNVLMSECGGRQTIANAGAWPLGAMAVSVRAVDPQGICGEWSEAASFKNETANALFTMSHGRMTTADTLVIKTIDGSAATITASPDGDILSSAGGETKVTFATAGNKTIVAKTATGGTTTDKIYVEPLKMVGMFDTYGVDFSQGFDFNQSGTIEGLAYSNGLYTFADGRYSLSPSFGLSDVEINPIAIADYDMDGQPDIFGTNRKNGNICPWLVNDGDLEFTSVSNAYKDETGSAFDLHYVNGVADFDNDGRVDFICKDKLYRNLGAGSVEYVAWPAIDGWNPNEVMGVADFDRDGLVDVIMRYYNPNYTSREERMSTYVMRNLGGMTFEPVVVFDRKDYGISSLADVNNDGYPDIVTSSNDIYTAYLGGRDLKFDTEMALPGNPMYTDLDNDGLCDYITLNARGSVDGLLLSSMDGVKMDFSDLSYFSDERYTYDTNADGRPDIQENLILSRFCNTAPTAPTSVYANMTGAYVTINWSGATDAESTPNRLRYNVSVRKKGATGDDSYIISPLNATDSKAATAPTGYEHYRYGTSMSIPVERFEAGTAYEICVQTVDPWHAHSPFSEVFELTPTATALITMAQKGGVDRPMPFQIHDNSGAEPVIDTDGGTRSGNTITWSTSGLKTVSVTAGTATVEHRIMIVDRPNLRVTLPKQMLTGVPVTVAMPEALVQDGTVESRVWATDGLSVDYDALSNTATVTPQADGSHTLYVSYTDDVFTTALSEYAETEAVGDGFRPELTMVGVDAATGKNRISWNAAQTQPGTQLFTGAMAVYRETNIAGSFEKIAEVPLTDGAYVDNGSRPDVQSNRYMLVMPTTYGAESQPSAIHGSIHLMVNRGMGNDINLHWTPYEGAEIAQYTILSGSSADNLQPLEQLSGYAQSYTHKRTGYATTYYSIAYTLQPQTTARRTRATGTAEGASNVISSAEAYAVTMVESIAISTREGSTELTAAQPQLHLTATVLPALATIARVEWSITTGSDLATIASDGTLTALDNTTGGTVTVRARAVDGSSAEATLDITVQSMDTGIAAATAAENAPTVRMVNHAVIIDNVTAPTDVTVLTASGAIVHRSVASSQLRIPLQPGFYIVKAGRTVRKVGVR